jgi:acyl dehydratase
MTETAAEDDNGPMFTTRSTLFIRGAGGFGGERGPSTAGLNVPPERQPDHVVEDVTRPEQGAIYRLSGDFNPLHIDPDFAKMAGFDKPIVHGLCTYGFAGRAILRVLCGGEPSRFESFDARFADNVYFGDTIITKIWRTGAGEAIVQAETQKGNVVLAQAKATYKE